MLNNELTALDLAMRMEAAVEPTDLTSTHSTPARLSVLPGPIFLASPCLREFPVSRPVRPEAEREPGEPIDSSAPGAVRLAGGSQFSPVLGSNATDVV